jgi:(S)-mandelate dehydrogenase
VERWRRLARRRLPRAIFDYLDGGAGEELCLMRNRQALQNTLLVPEVLRPVHECDMRTDFFGVSSSLPLVIAPTGLNGLLWGQGDLVLAMGAREMGIPFVLSTPSNASIAQVAALGLQDLWFQLYVLELRQIAERLLKEAQARGFRVLLLTVDSPVGARRLRDERNRFTFPPRLTPRLLCDVLAHPRWLIQLLRHGLPTFANFSAADGDHGARELAERTMDRALSWRSLEWIRSLWPGPVVIKGVLNVSDAIRARESGMDGIVVSNHGGRQLDAAPASIEVLGPIVDAVGRDMTVLIDSGFRSGSDVAKACALGARGVLLGRATLYGLAAAGLTGVRAVLEEFRDDLQRTLVLLGVQSVAELTTRALHTQAPVLYAKSPSLTPPGRASS